MGGCVAGIPVKKRSRLTDRPLLQATEALLFFQRWSIVQGSSTTGGTCLMECGPADQDQCRKWVMDIDGGLAELRAQGFLGEDELCGEEVCSAQRLLGSSGPAPPDAYIYRSTGQDCMAWSSSLRAISAMRSILNAFSSKSHATSPSNQGRYEEPLAIPSIALTTPEAGIRNCRTESITRNCHGTSRSWLWRPTRPGETRCNTLRKRYALSAPLGSI